MAHTDVVYRDMISIVSGTAKVSSAAQRSTIPKEKFHNSKIVSFLLTCMHIPRKKEFSCMAAKTEAVPSSPGICPISSGRKYPVSTTINATSACGWGEKGHLGLQSIKSLDYPTVTPWKIPSVLPLRRESTSLWKITAISAKESPRLLENTFVVKIRIPLLKSSKNYGSIKILWRWVVLRMPIPAKTVN